jgi:tetratricopeptide (TPR) repeat protein
MYFFVSLFLIFCTASGCKSGSEKAFDEAYKLVNEERYPEAIESLSNSIVKYPNHSGLFFLRGFCYISVDDGEKSLSDFTNSITLDNKNADGYYGLALYYHYITDEYDLANSNYNKAIGLAKNNKRKFYYFGGLSQLKYDIGDYEAAIDYINQAIKINDISDGYYFLGLYLNENGMKKEAEEAWLKGLNKDKFVQTVMKHSIYEKLAYYYYDNNNYIEALHNIEKALELSPENMDYLELFNTIRSRM